MMKSIAIVGVLAVMTLLAGCASHVQLAQDHFMKTDLTEHRSPLGTNGGFIRLQHCEKDYDKAGVFYEPKNCKTILVNGQEWNPVSSQGQGGQIIGGVATGIGAGVGGAMVNTSASAISNAASSVSKGHGR